jgi:hypothetical protein
VNRHSGWCLKGVLTDRKFPEVVASVFARRSSATDGNLDRAKICTSHVERQNLTIRM